MFSLSRIQSFLQRANLSEAEIQLYLYILGNPGCNVADACRKLKISKSTIYRAFEKLSSLEMVNSKSNKWETELHANSLHGLIKILENEQRKNRRLIEMLKTVESRKLLHHNSQISGMEILDEEETIERYIDLSEMKWNSVFVFGSWEDFNNVRNIIPTEQKFINNRIKNGGKAFVAITKDGPATREIIDFNHEIDKKEERVSKKAEFYQKPVWVNVFDGNNYVSLWNFNSHGRIASTFIESAPLAEFYRNFIYKTIV